MFFSFFHKPRLLRIVNQIDKHIALVGCRVWQIEHIVAFWIHSDWSSIDNQFVILKTSAVQFLV